MLLLMGMFACGSTKIRKTVAVHNYLLEMNQKGELNGNILIQNGKKVIYEHSIGISEGESKKLLQSSDSFNIGSVSKEFPAVAIMQLVEKNKLSVTDPISKFVKLPHWSNEVCIENLLHYSSGLPRISWGKSPLVNKESLLTELNTIENLNFEPGSDYLYTNYSPFLLTQIIEALDGRSFEQYAQEEILEPVKMGDTFFQNEFPFINTNRMATPFNEAFEADKTPFKIQIPTVLLSTTTSDLNKYLNALHDGEIISQESIHFLGRTADVANDDLQSPLGNLKIENGRVKQHWHHGSSGNYECLLSYYSEKRLNIIILTS
ncbi:MAG: CubicO group peptidase (beta-lactamase class C family) [Arcticibacterium sp.]|jgi:CubicO group peptidase (beta-lactamase class C family)